jgi:hypothetical protein
VECAEGFSKEMGGYWALDINRLSEKGCLRPGYSSACQWIDGSEVFSINICAEG